MHKPQPWEQAGYVPRLCSGQVRAPALGPILEKAPARAPHLPVSYRWRLSLPPLHGTADLLALQSMLSP